MTKARIYVFGDSLTYGAWDSQGGWCDRLKRKLHQASIHTQLQSKFQLFNLGIGGEASASLVNRLKVELSHRHRPDWPAIIIIATGANDTRFTSENTEPATSPNQYRQNLQVLIQTSRQFTQKILFVGLAPVKNDLQPFKHTLLSNDLLHKYDQINSQVAEQLQIPKVTIWDQLKKSTHPIHSTDEVHLNEHGHHLIQTQVWKSLEPLLN